MKRVIKPEGACRVEVEDVPVPEARTTEVLIRAERTLISRGSEIWRRYVREEAVDHAIMGYSMAGSIVQVGAAVEEFTMGERVAAVAPHAQWVTVEIQNPRPDPPVVIVPNTIDAEGATFWPLVTSSVLWMETIAAAEDDTVVIVGQGLVGSICAQVLRATVPCRVIAIDALPLRCEMARRFGADTVVDVSKEDPVAAVQALTDGRGADIVVEAVGGRGGSRAFEQGLEMVRPGGLVQVLGLYEDTPLQLDSSKIQGKRLVGGYLNAAERPRASDRALGLLENGKIHTAEMITHRFACDDAPEAFDLLYSRLSEAMAVVLTWQ